MSVIGLFILEWDPLIEILFCSTTTGQTLHWLSLRNINTPTWLS